MKRLFASLLLLLLATSSFGQELKLPAEVRGMTGAWIPVKPEVISGGKPKWRIDPALQEIDIEDFFGPEAAMSAKGKIFQCTDPAGGKFKVECWNALGDVPSEIQTCWLVVTGIAPPVVIPPAPPDPDVPPPTPPTPDPTPAGPRTVLIVHESSKKNQVWNNTITKLRSGPSAEYLNIKSHKLTLLDTDEVGPGGKPSPTLEAWRPFFSGMELPVVFIYDPATRNILLKKSVPQTTTDSNIVDLLKAHGG